VYYRTAEGIVAICAVNDLKSVDVIVSKMQRILNVKRDFLYVPLVVGINKMDLDVKEHVVTHEIVRNAFEEIGVNNFSIFNISAKTGDNIDSMMEEITRRCRYISRDVVEILQKVISLDSAVLKDENPKKVFHYVIVSPHILMVNRISTLT